MLEAYYFDNIEKLSSVGIYKIYHVYNTNKFYIGSTTTNNGRISHIGFYKRFYDHIRSLKLNKHYSKYLQNIVNKHKIEGLRFEILEVCDNMSVMEIRNREQHYINILKPELNAFKTVYPNGRIWSDKERKAQSLKLKGIPLPENVYKKISKSVLKIDLTTNEILETYPSMLHAAKALNIDRASISKCASGKRKSAGGYSWKITN